MGMGVVKGLRRDVTPNPISLTEKSIGQCSSLPYNAYWAFLRPNEVELKGFECFWA